MAEKKSLETDLENAGQLICHSCIEELDVVAVLVCGEHPVVDHGIAVDEASVDCIEAVAVVLVVVVVQASDVEVRIGLGELEAAGHDSGSCGECCLGTCQETECRGIPLALARTGELVDCELCIGVDACKRGVVGFEDQQRVGIARNIFVVHEAERVDLGERELLRVGIAVTVNGIGVGPEHAGFVDNETYFVLEHVELDSVDQHGLVAVEAVVLGVVRIERIDCGDQRVLEGIEEGVETGHGMHGEGIREHQVAGFTASPGESVAAGHE